jgi:hypothetical protein
MSQQTNSFSFGHKLYFLQTIHIERTFLDQEDFYKICFETHHQTILSLFPQQNVY